MTTTTTGARERKGAGLRTICACVTATKISEVRKLVDKPHHIACRRVVVVVKRSGWIDFALAKMSFLLDPYDNRDDGDTGTNHQDCPGEDELFVFGYACKLFRDDDKALLENSGQLLIPWMGDGSLMIDR